MSLEVQSFKYDPLGRLTEATGQYNNSSTVTKTYAYDEAGNITEKDNKTYEYDCSNAACGADLRIGFVFKSNGQKIVV